MKKIVTILMLVVAVLIGGVTVDAKTTKKKANTKSHSTVIGKFKYDGSTISLLSNGNIKCTYKCIGGDYEKIKGAYKVYLSPGAYDCGLWYYSLLIVGDNVYYIGGGGTIYDIVDYTFNPSDNTVTRINNSFGSDREYMEHHDLPSMTSPLSYFKKLGKVSWIKKKP